MLGSRSWPLVFENLLLFLVLNALESVCLVHGQQSIEFTLEPSDDVVVQGRPATLHCKVKVQDASPEAVQIFIRWRGDDPSTFFDHRDPRRSILANGSLFIPRVSIEDQGDYQCVASIDPYGAIASRVAYLQVISVVTFIDNQPQDLRVYPGQTAHFSCRTSQLPQYHITWLKDDQPLVLDAPRMSIMPSGSLEIDEVAESDQGSYRCNASIGGLYKLNNKGILTVNTDLVAGSRHNSPFFITQPKSAKVREGESVTLDCAANGNPRPWLLWLKDGAAIDMSDSKFLKKGTGSLHIVDIAEKDSGNYLCRAENVEDSVDASATVEVQVPPKFRRKPQDVVASVKKDIELGCQVYGKPDPKVQWLKNGEVIKMNDYLQLTNGHNLKILGLMDMDAGIFQCVASNAAGNIQASSTLTVIQPDSTNKTKDVFPLKSDSVGGLPLDSEYEDDEYEDDYDELPLPLEPSLGPRRMGKENKPSRQYFTDNSEKAVSLVPGAPQDLRAEIISNRFVTLIWKKPEETNGDLLSYSVYYRFEGSPRERVVNISAPNMEEVTVQGLQPDRLYHFRVVAHNALGPGESSEDLSVATGAEAHVPTAPVDLHAVATSPTSIYVEWRAPTSTTGDALKYRLFYMEEDSTEESYKETMETFYELKELKKFTEYCLWVIAMNSNGLGGASEEITLKTLSDLPSEPPMNITVEAASSTSIIVRWEPPLKEGQNGVITGYKLRYKKLKDRGMVVTAAGDRRLYSITELEKGTTYQVRLSAMNVNGTGPSSDWYSIDTFDNDLDETQVPGKPSNLIPRPGPVSIRVSWSPPKESNIMVRGYTIGWGIGIPDLYTKVLESKQRFFNIDDLKVNSEYVIAVRAFNKIGDGPPAYESVRTREEQTTETQAPLIPPVGLKAIVLSSTTVVLYWTDTPMSKSQGNSDDKYYTVRYTWEHHTSNPRPKYLNVTDNNCMITELRPNTLYEFSVKSIKGRRESKWSMVVHNTTQEAQPSTPPRNLTLVPMDGNPGQIILNWHPPKQANGLITGYVIFYTTVDSPRENDWVQQSITGGTMTAVVKGLQPSTTYYFKIQARNSKGYGPLSNRVLFTTPVGSVSNDFSVFGKDSRLSNMMLIILGCSLVAALCVFAIIMVVCCKRAKSRRRNDSYMKGNLKIKTSVKPPDLWIHHDQMELKNLEKSHHSNSDIGPSSSGSQMNTLVKTTSSHPSEFDHTGSIDKRTYVPSYVGSGSSNQEKTSTIKRAGKPKLISLPMDCQSVTQPVVSATPSPGCELSRSVYPRTQYRSHLTMDSAVSAESPYSMQGGYDCIPPIQYSATMPSAYPTTGSVVPCGGMTAPPGQPVCQIDGNSTLTKRQHTHPLKSFSVPAPPPQSAPTTPQQKHVVRPQQGSSPYKKPSHGMVCAGGSPSNTKLRTGPGTVEETTRLQPSYSTEELNQEMANLEGLMKDLNAITASEFEC